VAAGGASVWSIARRRIFWAGVDWAFSANGAGLDAEVWSRDRPCAMRVDLSTRRQPAGYMIGSPMEGWAKF
jgi:hypothetical protein